MNNIEQVKEKGALKKIWEKLKQKKIIEYVLLSILAIAIIIIFSTSFNKEKDNENKLSKTLSKIDGAGKVEVVITVNSGMETVLAMETVTEESLNGKTITEKPILVNGKTVVLKEVYPKIVGVLIVAEGANKISVMQKIQSATVSLLEIEVNQIEILAMKN